MPTKTTGKGLQRVTSRVWYVTDPDKPRPPGTRSKGGEAMLCCFREEEEKTRDVRKNLFIYESWFCLLTILMDSQVSKSLKQQFLILLLCRPALHLSQIERGGAQIDKHYRQGHCLQFNRSTCRWGEGRDVQTCCRGGLANHNTLSQLTNLSPSRISEGGAS